MRLIDSAPSTSVAASTAWSRSSERRRSRHAITTVDAQRARKNEPGITEPVVTSTCAVVGTSALVNGVAGLRWARRTFSPCPRPTGLCGGFRK